MPKQNPIDAPPLHTALPISAPFGRIQPYLPRSTRTMQKAQSFDWAF
jgi:hypothetical protein